MKRLLSLLLCFILLVSVYIPSYALVDLNPVLNSDLFSVDINEEGDCAFITTSLSLSDRAFYHKRESIFLNSNTQFDVLVLDYSGDSYPIFRLWINYTADKFNNITGATFTLDGKRFSFSGISSDDRLYDLDVCVLENLLIRFGTENSEFVSALLSYAGNFFNDDLTSKNLDQVSIPLTLHGDEVIETALDGSFLLDFMAMVTTFIGFGGGSYMNRSSATPMKVSNSTAANGTPVSGIPTDFIFLSGEIYVEALGEKLNGPGIDSDKVNLTLGDKTARDGITVDLDYFGILYHGTVEGERIIWDKEPAITANAEEMYTEISNQGNFVVIDFHFKTGDIWMVNEHIYKAK